MGTGPSAIGHCRIRYGYIGHGNKENMGKQYQPESICLDFSGTQRVTEDYQRWRKIAAEVLADRCHYEITIQSHKALSLNSLVMFFCHKPQRK